MSLGVASGHQVLEAIEEVLGVDDGVGGVGERHVKRPRSIFNAAYSRDAEVHERTHHPSTRKSSYPSRPLGLRRCAGPWLS